MKIEYYEANFWIRGHRGDDPDFHIGKGFWNKHDIFVNFSWAMEPENFLSLGNDWKPSCFACGRAFDDPQYVIEDEYGRLYTMETFKGMVTSIREPDLSKVGKRFL